MGQTSSQSVEKESDGLTSKDGGGKRAINEIKQLVFGEEKVKDSTDVEAEKIRPELWEFPFENLVMEGGGNKGVAYAGLYRCLEHMGVASKLKRFAGASAGAMAATIIALGYTPDEFESILSENLEPLFNDSTAWASAVWDVFTEYGWNPAHKFYDWMSEKIAAKSSTRNKGMTFYDLYKERGVELCIVVTNMNLMRTQYCHPKTTPDMEIRDAVRMSMSIPLYFQPFRYSMTGHPEKKDLYVDGGVLNNYPIDCFDGWGLSMELNDTYLRRLHPMSQAGENLKNRFTGFNNKTMGAVLYSKYERDPMRANLENRIGANEPVAPRLDTELYMSKSTGFQKWAMSTYPKKMKIESMTAFLNALGNCAVGNSEYIQMEQLTSALAQIKEEQAKSLFGTKHDPETVMSRFDKNGDKKLSLTEVLYQFEKDGLEIREFIYGFGKKKIDGISNFATSLYETTCLNLAEGRLKGDDVMRTVGIDTGYIGTLDFTLAEADKDFALDRGYNATKAFLKYYVVAHRESGLVYKKGSKPPQNE